MCGDCTDGAVVEQVMGGEKATLVVTDPPYDIGKAKWDTVGDYTLFLESIGCLVLETLDENGASYVFGWPGKIALAFSCYPITDSRILVWHYDNKNTPNQSSWGHSFELIIYSWVGVPIFNKDAGRVPYKQSSVDRAKYGLDSKWGGGKGAEYSLNKKGAQPRDVLFYPVLCAGRGQVERVAHPTQKPIDLIETIIGVSSDHDQIVADFFLGSGTTLVACERLGRLGRGVEIEPKYVAVTLERLQGLGLDPQRID